MPPRGVKAGVRSINVLADRQTIEECELAHDLRMVERKAEGIVPTVHSSTLGSVRRSTCGQLRRAVRSRP
jgi:hypothetical protein